MERVKGIEPSYEAWEAAVLPLNYTRSSRDYRQHLQAQPPMPVWLSSDHMRAHWAALAAAKKAEAVRYTATAWMTFKKRWPLGCPPGCWFGLPALRRARIRRQRLSSLSETKNQCRSVGKTPLWARMERSGRQRSTALNMASRQNSPIRWVASRRLTVASRQWSDAIERTRSQRGIFLCSQCALVLDVHAQAAIKLIAACAHAHLPLWMSPTHRYLIST